MIEDGRIEEPFTGREELPFLEPHMRLQQGCEPLEGIEIPAPSPAEQRPQVLVLR